MKAIVKVAPAAKASTLPAIISGGFQTLPEPVQDGIVRLTVVFGGGLENRSDEEKAMWLEGCAEAISGNPAFIVTWALKHLRLHNPRNPFVPTPQDLHELCNKTRGEWGRALCEYASTGKWLPPKVVARAAQRLSRPDATSNRTPALCFSANGPFSGITRTIRA